MKKLYNVGTAQFFSYTIYPDIFSKNKEPKVEKYWVLRNKKIIYAESERSQRRSIVHGLKRPIRE